MKKTLLVLLSTSYLFSANLPSNSAKFDGTNGWWWYEEEVKDPETKEIKTISYKMTPAEKRQLEVQKETNKLLKILIKEQKETKKLTKIVAERLMYAYPNTTPKYTINKKTGKKCLTNSSMDCFVMPVITEGQHVPALKEFLRNPSPENSKNWLQWQATYFNHINKVSNGLRFAYLKDGSEAYPTTTDYSYGDSLDKPQARNAISAREEMIIEGLKDNIAYLFFLGENGVFEESADIFTDIGSLNTRYMKKMKKAFIFRDKKTVDKMDAYIQQFYVEKMKTNYISDGWNSIKKVVDPKLFEKRKIRLTPTVVIYYKTPEMEKPLYQKIQVGNLSVNSIKSSTMRFLEYNDIIKPADRASEKNWSTLETNHIKKDEFKLPKAVIPTEFKKNKKGGNEK